MTKEAKKKRQLIHRERRASKKLKRAEKETEIDNDFVIPVKTKQHLSYKQKLK